MRFLNIIVISAILALAACGDDDSDKGNNANNANNVNNANNGGFDCEGVSCDASTSYCLVTYSNNEVVTNDCVALPDGCDACGDCISDDAPLQFPDTNNCDGVVSCIQAGDMIRAECVVPPSL